MGKRVFLDRGGERAQLLPFRNALALAVALVPQIPQPPVVELDWSFAAMKSEAASA